MGAATLCHIRSRHTSTGVASCGLITQWQHDKEAEAATSLNEGRNENCCENLILRVQQERAGFL